MNLRKLTCLAGSPRCEAGRRAHAVSLVSWAECHASGRSASGGKSAEAEDISSHLSLGLRPMSSAKADKSMARGKTIEKSISRNILENTLNATAWVFELLIFMGVASIEVFLKPSYYADLPSSSFSFGNKKDFTKKGKDLKEMTIRQSIWKLQKMGFVKKREGKYSLTFLGRKLAEYVLARKKIMSGKWDGNYRVVIFDIPEKNRKTRDWLRSELYLLKYKKLQESVFIGKHPLTADLIKEIKRLKIGNCVNYLLANKVYKNIL